MSNKIEIIQFQIWRKCSLLDISIIKRVPLPRQEPEASLAYKLRSAWALRAPAPSPDKSLEFYAAE